MKKLFIGLLIGVIFTLPATVAASRTDNTPFTNVIYYFAPGCSDNTDRTQNDHCGEVSVFDDQDNKCYVVYQTRQTASPAISCVKR